MYSKLPNLVIGFHGCNKDVFNKVVCNGEHLVASSNSYDWLGNGIYFWEADPYRAYEWAVEASKRKDSSVKEPAVLGAVLDLGHCLDLMLIIQFHNNYMPQSNKLLLGGLIFYCT